VIRLLEKKQIKNRRKAEKENTFSKSILSIIVMLYILGAILGTFLVIIAAIVDVKQGFPLDSSMFVAYAAYVGGPTATSIIFYAWKSKAENVIKIAQSCAEEQRLETMEIISKIGDM
jgi:hypothetical protein